MVEVSMFDLLPPDWWVHAAVVVVLAILLRISRPAFLAFRRRRSAFGTVFNSHTGNPEALVAVTLNDHHGAVVRTAVTDRQGRYRLVAPKGEYTVSCRKHGFHFPSVYISKHATSSVYENLLPSTHIIIKDYGTITKNIPIDPEGAVGRSKIFTGGISLGKQTQYAIALSSIAVASGYAWFRPSWVSWGIFSLQTLIVLGRFFSFRPAKPPFGTIRDAETKLPVDRAHIRIFESKFNKLLETQTTSPKGRYAFVVHPGTYQVLITKKGYKTVILKFPHIAQDGYLITKDVFLKRRTTSG
jgi:hypothetical protein